MIKDYRLKIEEFSFLIYLLIGVILIFYYSNTLRNGFVHDDIWQVEQNQVIRDVSRLPEIFSGCIAGELLGGCKNIGFYYRPTQALFYMLISRISQSPWIFHLANLILGAIAGSLVFKLLELIFKNRIYAFAGALFFITHPVNSEVFNWISATPEILTAVFLLLTLILYQLYLEKKKSGFLAGSIFAFFLGLLTKETMIFYLPILGLMVLLSQKNKIKPQNFYNLVWFFIPVLIYLMIRLSVLGRVVYKYEGYYSMGFLTQVFTALTLFPKYLLKLIYPFPLSFQPVIVPLTEYDNTVTLSVIGLAFILGLSYYFYQTKQKNLLLGLGIIVSGIFPALIFVNKLGENLFSERYLFIPVIGFCLILMDLIEKGSRRYKFLSKNILIGALIIYLCISFFTVFQRAADWRDNFSTYQAMVRVDPNHKKAHLMLGQIYQQRGEMQTAVKAYERALAIDPQYTEAKNALDLLTRRYKSKTGLSFYYPENWNLEDGESIVLIKDPEDEFSVELKIIEPEKDQTVEEYVIENKLKDSEGVLKNQGLAKIPNFDKAFVNVYELASKPKLQFFLSGGQKIVEVLVFPSNSPLMPEFDKILGSIKIQ